MPVRKKNRTYFVWEHFLRAECNKTFPSINTLSNSIRRRDNVLKKLFLFSKITGLICNQVLICKVVLPTASSPPITVTTIPTCFWTKIYLQKYSRIKKIFFCIIWQYLVGTSNGTMREYW